MTTSFRLALIVALSSVLLASCGNKGPLVMPSPKPASAPAPSDQPDKPKDTTDKPSSSR